MFYHWKLPLSDIEKDVDEQGMYFFDDDSKKLNNGSGSVGEKP